MKLLLVEDAEMLGKAIELVTPSERKQAKPVNFGFAFGMGAERLVGYARDNYGVDLTQAQAVSFRNAYFRLYRSVRDWHRRVSNTAGITTEVRTASGRLRKLQAKGGRAPFTEILNTPVQGTEADGMKRSLALLHPRLKAFGARFKAGPGWTWLTGEVGDVERVLKGLGAFTPNFSEHAPMMLVGDGRTGAWTRYNGFPDTKLKLVAGELTAIRIR